MRQTFSYTISGGLVPGSILPGYAEREVSSDLMSREVPPNVLCYARPDLWHERVWKMLSDLITDEVRAEFLASPPEYVVSDDLSWLDTIIEAVSGEQTDIKEVTADRLVEEFEAFRMFHATRTGDLAPYYERGLRFLSNREIEDRAREIFLNGKFATANEASLSAAIEDLTKPFVYRSEMQSRLYCCTDEAAFTTSAGGCGHYLDFGSEYLFNLGLRLTIDFEAKEALRAAGSPTLFVLDVPMSLISRETILEFSGSLLEHLFCSLSDDLEAYTLSPGAGTAVVLRKEIPPSAFFGHFHPKHFYHTHK